MYVTVDQDHILRVLEQTGCLTVTQAHRLLRISNPKSQESYARRILNQLQHIQRARLKTDDTFVAAFDRQTGGRRYVGRRGRHA